MEKIYLSSTITLIITLIVGAFFIVLGHINLKKIPDNKSHIVGDRNESIFSLTTSLSASALGAWILFGPASAATWGGIGSVIGYSLGTAFPMIALIYLGTKLRSIFPKGKTLTEFIKNRFGIDGITYPATINTNIGQVKIYEGSSQFGKEAQSKMDNSSEFLRKELANKYKDMEKKVDGFE